MRSLAISALFLGLLLALPAQADDQTQANRLFVEATKLVEQARATQDLHRRAQSYQDALERLETIVGRYPGSDVAVQMATGQQIGPPPSFPGCRATGTHSGYPKPRRGLKAQSPTTNGSKPKTPGSVTGWPG